MSTAADRPYRVVYTEAAREEVRRLIAQSRIIGLSRELLSAIQAIEQCLRLNPLVFGEPRKDFLPAGLQSRRGGRDMLYVTFGVDAANRVVYVTELHGSSNRGF